MASEKVILVVAVEEKTKDDNAWLEIKDGEGKTHRIFPSVEHEGQWFELDGKFPLIKASKGKYLKLTKVKKGKYWNVIGVEEAEAPAPGTEPPSGGEERGSSTNSSIEAQVAYKGIVELRLGDKLDKNDKSYLVALKWAEAKMNQSLSISPKEEAEPKKSPADKKSSATAPVAEDGKDWSQAKRELYDFIKEKRKFMDDKTVTNYLENVAKIDMSLLETDPNKVMELITEMEGF